MKKAGNKKKNKIRRKGARAVQQSGAATESIDPGRFRFFNTTGLHTTPAGYVKSTRAQRSRAIVRKLPY
jgi:hypothetical protein